MIFAYVLPFSISFLVAFGIYNIFLSIFKIPRYNNEFFTIFKKKKDINKTDNYSYLTHKLAEVIKIPKFMYDSLEEKMMILGMKSTPELYVSEILIKSFQYLILGIIFIIVHPIFTIMFIFFAIQNVFKGYKKIDEELKEKTDKIEREIPKFLDYMTNSFRFNKGVKQALESYQKVAGEYFRANIEITIADMATGNHEMALKRLDARINSYNFSRVIRAIIQVLRGEENTQYLSNLYRESATKEYEALKREADRKVEKVGEYSKIMFVLILVMIFTILGTMLYKNFIEMGEI